jgi:hypothetical protein
MARDYFQDITPPNTGTTQIPVRPVRAPEMPSMLSVPTPTPAAVSMHDEPIAEEHADMAYEAPRSIRNVTIPPRSRARIDDGAMPPRGGVPVFDEDEGSGHRRFWMWFIAGIAVLILAGVSSFFFMSTTVTVQPRMHTVVFDPTIQFTAAPAVDAATGTIPYTIATKDLDDSVLVPAGPVSHVETRAHGTITIANETSAPVRLIKNTRFESATGLVFRIPDSVTVPAKKGTVSGSITTTVTADQPGDTYNIAPGRFSVPGLKGSADLYTHVYATSASVFVGGFSGDTASVDPAAASAARAQVRSRLTDAVRTAAKAMTGGFIIPDLVSVTYTSLPDTTEGDNVRIHEQAHVVVPVFPADIFAQVVGGLVSADAAHDSVMLSAGDGFTASATPDALASLGTVPFAFTLKGTGILTWKVDGHALAEALAGKDQSAFQTIVKDFPGIEEAHARVEPFWSSSFPADAGRIFVTVATETASTY